MLENIEMNGDSFRFDSAIPMYNSVEIINGDTALLIKSESTKNCQTMPSSNSQH